MTTPIRCDENGFVRGFSYHDGFLDGVVTAGSDVLLALRSKDGEQRVLTLHRVTALHIDNFRERNIVLNLRMLGAERAAADVDGRQRLVERLFLDPAKLATESSVFLLDASFGGEVVAICSAADVSEVATTLSVAK
jgi:hypothetical protein